MIRYIITLKRRWCHVELIPHVLVNGVSQAAASRAREYTLIPCITLGPAEITSVRSLPSASLVIIRRLARPQQAENAARS